MKNGAQGMSKTANSTGEAVSRCTASRSFRPEAGFERSLDSTARRRLARKTRASSRAWNVAPMRAATRART